MNKQQHKKITWRFENYELSEKLQKFLIATTKTEDCCAVIGGTTIDSIDVMESESTDENSKFRGLLESITGKSKEIVPIYVCTEGNIGLLYLEKSFHCGDGSFCITYSTDEALTQFLQKINEQKVVEKKKKKSKTKIIKIHVNELSTVLYSDRNFDQFISCYKPKILSLLHHFINMNTGVTKKYFGSYNLGFMLYGKPGTGKTSFIKALSNFLRRDLHIVNMRNIKTCSDFQNIFSTNVTGAYGDKIFVFEEFDCVQGIFNRKDADNSSKIRELREEYYKCLSIQSEKNGSTIEKKLKEISTEIMNLEKALTIDNILTVLDGIIELRGRVIVATTNRIDQIDPALLREGRFDLKIKLEEFNNEETHELLSKYFESSDLSCLVGKVFPKQYTPVQIINHCRCYENIVDVVNFLEKPKEEGSKTEQLPLPPLPPPLPMWTLPSCTLPQPIEQVQEANSSDSDEDTTDNDSD